MFSQNFPGDIFDETFTQKFRLKSFVFFVAATPGTGSKKSCFFLKNKEIQLFFNSDFLYLKNLSKKIKIEKLFQYYQTRW